MLTRRYKDARVHWRGLFLVTFGEQEEILISEIVDCLQCITRHQRWYAESHLHVRLQKQVPFIFVGDALQWQVFNVIPNTTGETVDVMLSANLHHWAAGESRTFTESLQERCNGPRHVVVGHMGYIISI